MCWHTECVGRGKKPIKSGHVFVLTEFLEHLKDHVDALGMAMQKRFYAVHQNSFITKRELDEFAPVPLSLIVVENEFK